MAMMIGFDDQHVRLGVDAINERVARLRCRPASDVASVSLPQFPPPTLSAQTTGNGIEVTVTNPAHRDVMLQVQRPGGNWETISRQGGVTLLPTGDRIGDYAFRAYTAGCTGAAGLMTEKV